MSKQKKWIWLGITITVLFVCGWWSMRDTRIIEEVRLYQTVRGGEITPQAFLALTFLRDISDERFVSIGLDFNQDGSISSFEKDGVTYQEFVLTTLPTEASRGATERYAFVLDPKVSLTLPLSGELYFHTQPIAHGVPGDTLRERSREVVPFTISHIIPEVRDRVNTLDGTGMKATGLPSLPFTYVAHAESTGAGDTSGDYYARHLEVPDQDQLWNECAPTAISNSFRFLAKTYGLEHHMPKGDVNDLIDELKGDLAWDDGVSHEEIISGKTEFITRHALPIEAHQIGYQNDENIVRKMAIEIEKGQAIEAWLEFFNASGTPAGAHLVTVVGAGRKNGKDIVRFTDPDTTGQPSRDLYEVEGGNYLPGYWPGAQTYIRYAYAQSPIPSLLDKTWVDPRSDTAVAVGGGGVTLTPPEEDVTLSRSRSGFFSVSVGHPGDHVVGESFPVRATVRMTHKVREVSYRKNSENETFFHEAVEPWTLTGSFLAHGALTPTSVPDAPSQTEVAGERYTIEQTFTCIEPGFVSVAYVPTLSWTLKESPPQEVLALSHGVEFGLTSDTMQVSSPVFRCVDIPKDADNTPKSAFTPFCPGVVEDASSTPVSVIKSGEACFLASDFHIADPDKCSAKHWHANLGQARALTGKLWTDPSGCGLGEVDTILEGEVRLSADQYAPYLKD